MHAYKKYLITMGLVWAGALVVVVAAFIFLINPQVREKDRLAKEAADKQKLYNGAVEAAKEDTKKKLAAELESLKSKLNDYAIDSEDSANMTLDISRVATAGQVASFTIKNCEQQQSGQSDSKYLQENRIQISFSSDFRQFATLLNMLERHRPVIFVDNFRITRASDNNKVDMDLSIFVRKRPEG
ncbi:MAG: GspMb/PilO family protein [Sedimentisphaerales bacterium]